MEKEKRKFQGDVSDLSERLARALQRIEDLEATKARLEKELASMTTRCVH